jgi:hypothetical protein
MFAQGLFAASAAMLAVVLMSRLGGYSGLLCAGGLFGLHVARDWIPRPLRTALDIVVVGAAAGAILLLFAHGAQAAEAVEAPPATIGEAFRPYVELIVATAVTAFLGWLHTQLRRYFGVELDARHREALHSAMTTAANLLIAKAAAAGSAELQDGLDHVAVGAGDAIRHFGLDSRRLEKMLRSTLQRVDSDGLVTLEGQLLQPADAAAKAK